MAEVNSGTTSRPLLSKGEALRIDVTAPRQSGGTKFEPQTAEQAREILLPLLQKTVATGFSLNQKLRGERLYIEARLLPNYIAASSFPSELLTQIGAVAVGSRADQGIYKTKSKETKTGTRRMILSVDDRGLQALLELIQYGGQTKREKQAFHEIRTLDYISLSTPPTTLLDSESATWEAVLHPEIEIAGKVVATGDAVLGKWFQLVEELGGQPNRKYVRTVGGLTFMALTLRGDSIKLAAQFNPLRVLRPMPEIRIRPKIGRRSASVFLPPTPTSYPTNLPRVAVFDGGIARQTSLFPNSSIALTPEDPDLTDLAHGTGVTGIAMYGLVKPGDTASAPPLPVDSYRVLPTPNNPNDPDEYWIVDQIDKIVRETRPAIINLSIGLELAVDDKEPDYWTSKLDEIAWEYDTLFVVAAGNYGHLPQNTGLHRVQVPADMANGLSVGATDSLPPTRPWVRAPYSSMGPGRQGSRIQPICVQFGGVANNEFPLLTADGTFLYDAGTSYAAPLVTHALSQLSTHLPNHNPSVLRAFTTHFSERHPTHKRVRDEVGYGRAPLSFEQNLVCGADEVHVLYTDEVRRGELLGYQVPIPIGSTGDLEVRITLAYASPVNPKEPTEYTRASIELAFRPDARKYSFRPPKDLASKSQVHDLGSKEALKLLKDGWKPGQEPITRGLGTSGAIPEGQLRDEGKWETIRHTRISLKTGNYSDSRIEVSYLARQDGALDNARTAVPFALLITVVDKSKSGTLYDDVRRQFAVLQPMQRAQTRIQSQTQ